MLAFKMCTWYYTEHFNREHNLQHFAELTFKKNILFRILPKPSSNFKLTRKLIGPFIVWHVVFFFLVKRLIMRPTARSNDQRGYEQGRRAHAIHAVSDVYAAPLRHLHQIFPHARAADKRQTTPTCYLLTNRMIDSWTRHQTWTSTGVVFRNSPRYTDHRRVHSFQSIFFFFFFPL